MANTISIRVLVVGLCASLMACDENRSGASNREAGLATKTFKPHDGTMNPREFTSNAVPGRWYAPHEVERGAKLFDRYCSTCHVIRESGGFDWGDQAIKAKKAVPLDGEGHVWHHSLGELVDTVNQGNAKGMPALGQQLSPSEILDTIAFLQSNWSDEVYNAWYSVNHLEKAQSSD